VARVAAPAPDEGVDDEVADVDHGRPDRRLRQAGHEAGDRDQQPEPEGQAVQISARRADGAVDMGKKPRPMISLALARCEGALRGG
jgi:hypothetical protein